MIEFGVLISKTQARIGPRAYIGPRCHLGWAILEEGVLLGPAVHVTSGSHTHGLAGGDELIGDQPGRLRPVTVGRGAWIGAAAVVMNDVGAGTAVGAGAVVTRALPAGVVAVGVPARIVHRRDGAVQGRDESESEEHALPATGGT